MVDSDEKHCLFSFNGVLNVKGEQSNYMVNAFLVFEAKILGLRVFGLV